MSIAIIIFWALFLCLIVALIILTFPVSFARDSMKKGVRKIQKIFIIIDAIFCIIQILFNRLSCFNLPIIDIKIALMLIPVVACVVFSFFLYYPSVRFLVKFNLVDQTIIEELFTHIFNCAYGDNDNRHRALSTLDSFCKEQDQFIKQYGLNVYLREYKNHTDTVSHRPPENMINFVLNRCSQVKHDIDFFDPTPFPNIGLILSFVFSTILTILLSFITITPEIAVVSR